MLTKLIALALSCQFTVSVVERPAFTVTVLEPPAPPPPAEVEETPRRTYLAMFTAYYCGPCQQWKRTVLPQLQRDGYTVRQFEMTDPAINAKYGKRIPAYPSFAVIDYATGEWLSEVKVGHISKATAVRMLGGPAVSVSETVRSERVVSSSNLAPPARFIEWPGWGTIDLETYSRDCSCSMCQQIRVMQRDYWQQLRAWQSQTEVTPDQEGTPHDVVEDMLAQAGLQAGDVVGDLGCGDGRILIAAAKRGIRGIGVELDPVRADVARRNVAAAGVEDLVTIETGDALDFDVSRVTVATTYLYPPLLAKLAPKLRGLRVVASPYHEIPGLPMYRAGDVWYYEGGTDEQVMADDAIRDFRGHHVAARSGADASG